MDNKKEAMKLTIAMRIIEEMIFGENHEQATLTKEYFRGEFMSAFAKRATTLILAANHLYKLGASTEEAVKVVFMADKLASSPKNCDTCDLKEECKKEESLMSHICKN